ncbi:MAG: hypothetical protein R2792_03675 [Saprospiraceae bacterium]
MKNTLAILLLTTAQCALACSCDDSLVDLPVKEMGWTQNASEGLSGLSDLIFTGILLEVNVVEEIHQGYLFNERKVRQYELVFQQIKFYKGDSSDILKIRTNMGSDACGFGAKLHTECLIFANKSERGYYYTYRSDCCKSISKVEDEKRYAKYTQFMESILNMIDGEYVFYQSKSYWSGGHPDRADTLEAMRYTIRNGKFEGSWLIKDRSGRILEKGEYKNGLKTGVWLEVSYSDSPLEACERQKTTEKISYRNGAPMKSLVTIQDEQFSLEEPFGYRTVRKQKIKKRYSYLSVPNPLPNSQKHE